MKRKEFLLGLICGVVFCGLVPVAEATAEYVVARLTAQTIYLDGAKVNWTVYNVNDENYIKLADLCPELGVGLSWDSTNNAVRMTTDGTTSVVPPVTTPTVTSPSVSSGVTVIPQSTAKLDLEVGDVVLCDDGYEYKITDMTRYEHNSFSNYEPLPALPTQQGDWSNLPVLTMPEVKVTHFKDDYGDVMYITNLHEIERMKTVFYNLIANEPSAWNGSVPLATVTLGFDSYSNVPVMWPWDEQQIIDLFESRPISNFRVSASDYYANGIFQQTIYYVRGW